MNKPFLHQPDENLSKCSIVHCSFAVAARASSLQLYIASSSNFQLGAELSNEELGKMLPLLCLFCLQLLQPLQPRPIRPPAPRRAARRRFFLRFTAAAAAAALLHMQIYSEEITSRKTSCQLQAKACSMQPASQSYYCNSRQFCIFILLVFVYTEGILVHQKYLVNNRV